MKYFYTLLLAAALLPVSWPLLAGEQEIEQLRQQLEQLREEYDRRLEVLEQQLEAAQQTAATNVQTKAATSSLPPSPQQTMTAANSLAAVDAAAKGNTTFNPQISLILDGRLSHFSQHPEDYELSGFMPGAEAGPGEQGFAVGHNELVMSANADDKFYGRFTLAFGLHDGETEVEIEEALIETLGLDYGLGIRAGRFFSDIGYLNSRHQHQWDFADAPLVYRGLFGNQLIDDGIQLNWLAPVDLYLSLGTELFRGSRFPISADSGNSFGAYTLFAKTGGDIGNSSSWLAGISYLDAEPDAREASQDSHAEHDGDHLSPAFGGDSVTWGFDLVWKWAPDGNRRQRNLQLQYEYFHREDDGQLTAGDESGSYRGRQSGWYAQAVYQFMPRWRTGLRYDSLSSSASGSSLSLIEEAGLDSAGHDPKRFSLMADWSNSEFSRFRLQYNRDQSSPVTNDQWMLQYLLSLGAHGAHEY